MMNSARRRQTAGILLASVAFLLVASDVGLACPNCKDALATSSDGLNVARGYALSILIMLGMPFMLASSFGLYVWREMRRLKRQAEGPEVANPRP